MTEKDLTAEGQGGGPKLFFLRGAILGLIGGVLVAVMLMSIFGSVVSLADDLLGSGTATADEETTQTDPVLARGEELASLKACITCHTTNGVAMTGPSWKGLSETRSEDYIRQSILDPNADLAEGFDPDLMPQDYADQLSDDDLDALVAYIMSL